MDSHYLGYSVIGADLSYTSYPTPSSIPTSPESLKFDSTNSPDSPFSTPFRTDSLTMCGDRHSSTDYISEATPSSDSSVHHKINNFQQSPFSHQDSPSTPSASLPNHNIKHTLQELEKALMAPDADEEATTSQQSLGNRRSQTPIPDQSTRARSHEAHGPDSRAGSSSNQARFDYRHKEMEEESALRGGGPNNLKRLLIACARALSENKLDEFEKLVAHARAAVSITGEPIQRLGAYLVESLIARRESSGTNIYRALKCNEPASGDLLSYMHILYEICPYLKFGFMAANGAIAEACKNEARIHIIDFQIAQGTQWITLLQALAARPSGPPSIRITGIDDPVSKYARGDGLAAVERRLAAISDKFHIPVEFHAVPVFAPDITRAMLDIRPGEALAVNFPLQLHHTPDESVDVSNPRDGLLRMVKSLSPRVVTLIEQESNTNTAPFLPRFKEALDYYSAMFESIDVVLPRDRKERIDVELQCLARDMVNVIACEGKERVERHELLGKWRLRFMMAGFRQCGLSGYVNSVIRGLLRSYSENYTLVEQDGGLLLGWKGRNLVSASAWH